MIPLAELEAHLKTLQKEDWQPLFDLVSRLESASEYGSIEGLEKQPDGSVTFPYRKFNQDEDRFLYLVYDLGLIVEFDWLQWEEGREIFRDFENNIDHLDIMTICKLITAIVRNDRFCDGALIASFENGVMIKLLKRLQVNLS